jgi:tRNA dimethylallyltransferase
VDSVVSDRLAPIAMAAPVSSSAGECGVKDQVSRSEQLTNGPSAGEGHLALVGATGTGKTELAVAFARATPGVELVSVDAFSVYRGFDIGTAKPSAAQREGVVWHLLDLFDPHEECSVAAFQAAASAAIEEVEARGGRALLVGGTGLYHRCLVDDLELPGRFPAVRAELERRVGEPGGLDRLYQDLVARDPVAASRMEPGNARRVVRALEVVLGSGRRFSSYGPGLAAYRPSRFAQFGLYLDRAALEQRNTARLDRQLEEGFLDEVARLARHPGGLSRTASQALGYRELAAHLAGELDLASARARIIHNTRTYAKRQEAWFRRDPRIVWFEATRPDLLAALATGARGRP